MFAHQNAKLLKHLLSLMDAHAHLALIVVLNYVLQAFVFQIVVDKLEGTQILAIAHLTKNVFLDSVITTQILANHLAKLKDKLLVLLLTHASVLKMQNVLRALAQITNVFQIVQLVVAFQIMLTIVIAQ